MDSFLTNTLAVSVEGGNDGFLLLQILGWVLGILGLVFFLGSAVGMVRFPVLHRMHAAGKGGYSFHNVDAMRVRLGHHG